MIAKVTDFVDWKQLARAALIQSIRPDEIRFRDDRGQATLFEDEGLRAGGETEATFNVPRAFLSSAANVAYHRDGDRWNLLYRTLWRLKHGEPHLMEISTDDDVHRLAALEKQVRRDAHKMKAFVRFRKVSREGVDYFIAWHRPDHRVLRKIAPFFSRRFRAMHWTILTPDESVCWDQRELVYGPGVARTEAPQSDELEDLWRTYYGSIFNPARIKTGMMKREMPVRYWSTMPETEIIADLLANASDRVQDMLTNREGYAESAEAFIRSHPEAQESLQGLAELASNCVACDLHCAATQTVFGEGPASARIVLVGEQPGDSEDRQGRPFVGPAGQILNEVLAAAQIDRAAIYVTNVVKHFKHAVSSDARGKRRLHKRPDAYEVRVCKPWLEAEWKLLEEAAVLVCLGATAARAILRPDFHITRERGQIAATEMCSQTLATWHPSAVLRTPDGPQRELKRQQMIADLTLARIALASGEGSDSSAARLRPR